MKKKLALEEKPLFNVVTVYRERGNYLQRHEQFEKAIHAYTEALRWNDSDVRSLLGRSLARARSTHYAGALEDAARAAELEPENLSALQMRAQTEYEKCAFERSLLLAHRGQRLRRFPPNFAFVARIAEETIRECVNRNARKVLSSVSFIRRLEFKMADVDQYAPKVVIRQSRMHSNPTPQYQEMNRVEKHKARHMSRLMASKYLERMAHDKYFLQKLHKDERLISANQKDSLKLQELATCALTDIEKRQEVLRERCPFYAARASESAARARLSETRKKQLKRAQKQNIIDANRLLAAAEAMLEKRETAKCIENAEFAMEQISRKPANMIPGKEKFLHTLQNIVANAFLDQKRVSSRMSESDREKRAFALLGIALSREPSRDSVLKVRPPEPPRDAKRRLRALEMALSLSARPSERCYLLHELARLHIDTKQSIKARFYAYKCQAEARAASQRLWLLNACFLLARGHVMSNNRPEARASLIEAASLARSYRMPEVAEFFDTCINVSTEGEVEITEACIEKREKAMVGLMQDDDMKSEAQHLFRKMSTLPAQRRFSILPGARIEDKGYQGSKRRQSINPAAAQPTVSPIKDKDRHPLGFQDFDIL
ncbi:uncharacterized protein LOC126368815 [Pectinophora gossypiella]|uniref:uncharacterized protein LOC126368815 n=1 Tax=Pectinophora gossypiella TaxID=13191 RepID=UPI00214EA215|nr:uncharacterized protein LOC126368815 [Pectinophora gossypiella]